MRNRFVKIINQKYYMKQIQLIAISPEQLLDAIFEGVKLQFEDLKKNYKSKEPIEFLTRSDVAELLSVNISTVHNYCKRNVLQPYQMNGETGRVYFKRSEVEKAMIKLKK